MDNAVSTDKTCRHTSLLQVGKVQQDTTSDQTGACCSSHTLNKKGSFKPNLLRTGAPRAWECCSSQSCRLIEGLVASIAGPLGCVPILYIQTQRVRASACGQSATRFKVKSITHQSSAYGFSWSTLVPAAAVKAATCNAAQC